MDSEVPYSAALQWIQKFVVGPNMQRTIQKVIQICIVCAKNNPKTGPLPIVKGVQTLGAGLKQILSG